MSPPSQVKPRNTPNTRKPDRIFCVFRVFRGSPIDRQNLSILWLIMLGVFWHCPSRVFAQVVPPARIVSFTVFAAEPMADLGYVTPAGLVPLRFYPTARSPRYEHRGRQPLRLVRLPGGEPVAEVPIPAAWRDALLLLTRRAAGSGGFRYEVTPLDDGPGQRAAGQVQMLNLSGLDLMGELNGRRISLDAGLNPALAAGRSARLVLRTTFRGRSYLSWHDTITLAPSGRALLILFPPFLSGSVEVQTRVLLDEPPEFFEPAPRGG
jgi:hypothetical protein